MGLPIEIKLLSLEVNMQREKYWLRQQQYEDMHYYYQKIKHTSRGPGYYQTLNNVRVTAQSHKRIMMKKEEELTRRVLEYNPFLR